MQPKTAPKKSRNTNEKENETSVVPEFGVGEFGEDFDSECEELDNVQIVGGYDSGDDLARRLVKGVPSLREAEGEIQKKIDLKNYSVTVDEDRGLATTYARTTQRNRNRKIFLDAQEKLKQHKMRPLTNSFSVLYTAKGFKSYIDDAVAWQQRHASWIYNRPATVTLRRDMATPHDIARIEGINLDAPEDEDRTGLISGTEPSDDSGSDSTDDETSDGEIS